MNPAVEAAFHYSNSDAYRYVDYWDRLTAKSDAALFRRFLFAFMSVHTTWEINVNGYKEIQDFEAWKDGHFGLRTRLVRSGAGLHNNRTLWIQGFSDAFWADPRAYRRGVRESWHGYRDRLEKSITGLGPAKVSFALELAFPLEAEVLCLDVHMLRLYGKKDQNMRKNEYQAYEADWIGRSRAAGLPSYIVKQMHWDKLQGRSDSRYWSHVLEGELQ